jgi:hypothetical protein
MATGPGYALVISQSTTRALIPTRSVSKGIGGVVVVGREES